MLVATWSRLHPRRKSPWPGVGVDSHDGRSGRGFFDPATGVFRVLDPADDDALPGLVPALARGRLVSWRPGLRAVVRVIEPGGVLYLKVMPPARAAARAALLRALDALEEARTLLPRLRAVDPGLGHVLFEEVAGASLVERLDAGDGAGLFAAGGLLARFHALEPGPEFGSPLEPDDLEGWAERTARFFPDRAATVRAAFAATPPPGAGSATLIHGDVHGGNVIVARGRARLIDFDGAGRGTAARDLGNMLAWLELRALVRGRPAAELARWGARVLEGYASRGSPPPSDAIAAEHDRARFRLGCSHLFRRESRAHAPVLLGRCRT